METYYFMTWVTECTNGSRRYYYSRDLHLDRIKAKFEKTIRRNSTQDARLYKVERSNAESKYDLLRDYYR